MQQAGQEYYILYLKGIENPMSVWLWEVVGVPVQKDWRFVWFRMTSCDKSGNSVSHILRDLDLIRYEYLILLKFGRHV